MTQRQVSKCTNINVAGAWPLTLVGNWVQWHFTNWHDSHLEGEKLLRVGTNSLTSLGTDGHNVWICKDEADMELIVGKANS